MKVRMMIEQQNIEEFIDAVAEKYHFNEDDKDELLKVYEQMVLCMGPYASYRLNQKVTGLRIIDDSQAAIVAMTLGVGVDRLQDRYMRAEKLEQAYMLECISNELLLKMYSEFNKSYARFHRRYVQRYVFIGTEIPLTNIPKILDEIKGRRVDKKAQEEKSKTVNSEVEMGSEVSAKIVDSNEIIANEYGVLTPSKSVVFYAILSENPDQACEGICVGCDSIRCENRISEETHMGMTAISQEGTEDRVIYPDSIKPNLNYGFQRIFGS